MDRVGEIIAAELDRVKLQLKREQRRRREMERSRDLWKHRALTYSRRRKVAA